MLNKLAVTRSPVASAAALACLFVALAYSPAAQNLLAYQRDAIAHGEYWRVFTGHFVHLNLNHALLNSAGTLLLAFFLARDISVRQWWALTLLAPFFISLGLWFKQPTLMSYVGFSGVLQGLIYCSVIRLLREAPWLAGGVLVALISRQVWEQTSAYNPQYLQHLIHGRVMPDAHLFGAIAGAVFGVFSLWRNRLGKVSVSGYSPSVSSADSPSA